MPIDKNKKHTTEKLADIRSELKILAKELKSEFAKVFINQAILNIKFAVNTEYGIVKFEK